MKVCVSPVLTLLLYLYLLHAPISRKSLLLLYKRDFTLLCGLYSLWYNDPPSNNDENSPKLYCCVGFKEHCDVGICMSVIPDGKRYVFLYL